MEIQTITAQLMPWSHLTPRGELRGWMTPNCGHNGRPVIYFLHGNGLSSLTYWPFLHDFQLEYDLFLGAVVGHGDSDTPEMGAPFSWNQMADDARQALQTLRADWPSDTPVIGLGHSFGAICITLMHTQAPQLFNRLVLLDPVIFPKAMIAAIRLVNLLGVEHHIPHVKRALHRRHYWESREAVFDNLKERGVFKTWQKDALHCYINHGLQPDATGQWRLRCPPWLEARIFSTAPAGLWSAIAALPAHTEIIHATETFPFVPKGVAKAERANPNIRLTQVEGGHCFMQETPHKAYQLVSSLLRI